METPPSSSAHVTVVVRRPMNGHGTMTVEVVETNETRHVVDYATPLIRSTLSALPEGTTIPVELVRVGIRSNVWRVVDLPSNDGRTLSVGAGRDVEAGPEPARLP